MNNNIYLGDELQFDDDPFIGGEMEPEEQDHLLELCGGTLDNEVFEEEEDPQFHDMGGFQFDQNFCMIDVNEMPGAYAMDDGFGFDYEPETLALTMDPVNNEMEEQDWRLGQIIEEVAAAQPSAPVVPIKKARTVTAPQIAHNPRYHGIGNVPKYPVARNGVTKKPRTLYPVKVKRIVQQPRILTHGFNPYALQPVPARPRPPPMTWIEPENWHRGGNERTTDSGKRRLPIPRDCPSNQIRCYQCLSTFTTQLGLEFHEVERHSNVFAFECTECNNIYSDIREANRHIMSVHQKDIIPLLDSSIFGNGDVNDQGKKGSERRISGMISSFLRNRLAQFGKLKGTAEDNEIVSKEVKAVFNSTNSAEKADQPSEEGDKADNNICIEETASINDLLKREYIYGTSIRRVPLETVPQNKLIRRRYLNAPASIRTQNYLFPNNNGPNQPQHQQPPQPRAPVSMVRPVIPRRPANFTSTPLNVVKPASGVLVGPIVESNEPQLVKKTAFIQKPSPTGGATTHYLGNVYLAKSSHGTYMIADKAGTKRSAVRSESATTTGRKMIKVEMPPLLEHYAARDRPTVAPKPTADK